MAPTMRMLGKQSEEPAAGSEVSYYLACGYGLNDPLNWHVLRLPDTLSM